MIWLISYIATILFANWLFVTFGAVPVGFGLMAPAAVYGVGLAFTFRDLTQDSLGKRAVIAAILIGALLSAALNVQLAIASGVSFLASELADLAVYTPLRRRNWYGAVALSNTVGLVVDSVLFLSLAFGSLDYLAGQCVGKLSMTLLAVLVLSVIRRRWQTA